MADEIKDVRFKTMDSSIKERAIAAGYNVVESRGLKRGNMVLGKEYVFDAPSDEVCNKLGLTPPPIVKEKEKR